LQVSAAAPGACDVSGDVIVPGVELHNALGDRKIRTIDPCGDLFMSGPVDRVYIGGISL